MSTLQAYIEIFVMCVAFAMLVSIVLLACVLVAQTLSARDKPQEPTP